MKTEERIIDKALEMFNEKGIEYVGLRELAAALEMRVSNINYYFPTKDDLVYRLSLNLKEHNSLIVVDHKNLTVDTFLEMLQKTFRNHVKFRCLLLSFVHILEQNKRVSDRYKETQRDRNATIQANLKTLVKAGYLKVNDEKEIKFLVSTIALIARFWISEAAVSYRHLKQEEQINHYVSMIGQVMLPYLSTAGKKQVQRYLSVIA